MQWPFCDCLKSLKLITDRGFPKTVSVPLNELNTLATFKLLIKWPTRYLTVVLAADFIYLVLIFLMIFWVITKLGPIRRQHNVRWHQLSQIASPVLKIHHSNDIKGIFKLVIWVLASFIFSCESNCCRVDLCYWSLL